MAHRREEPSERVAHNGVHGRVAYARMPDGSYPAQEFFNSLGVQERAKFVSQFMAITADRNLQFRNRQQFRQVKDDLFEFKRNDIQMRLFTFRHNCLNPKIGIS